MTLVRGEYYPWLLFGPTLMMFEHLDSVGTLASPTASLEFTRRERQCPSAQGHSLSERSLATKHGRPEVLGCSHPRSTSQPTRPVSWYVNIHQGANSEVSLRGSPTGLSPGFRQQLPTHKAPFIDLLLSLLYPPPFSQCCLESLPEQSMCIAILPSGSV